MSERYCKIVFRKQQEEKSYLGDCPELFIKMGADPGCEKISDDIESGILHKEDICEETFSNYLTTRNLPDPDLLIRTGGEQRISNFLLWQSAYAEFYFTETFWPDFNDEELYKAILDYQKR